MAAGREGAHGAVEGGWKHGDLIQRHISAPTVNGGEPEPWLAAQASFDRVDDGHLWP